MAIQKTEALLLKRFDFRETSLIVHFYTRDFGKVSGILKGVRTDPGKFSSPLEIFSYNDIIFYPKSTTSLYLVSAAELRDNFSAIRQDIRKIVLASMMVELVDALMQPEDKNEEVFELLFSCLKALETSSNPEKILTIFNIKMLALSGFKPHFDSCVSCGQRVIQQAKFSLSLGGLVCGRCQPKDTAARNIFRGTIASILHIERNDFRTNLNLGLNPLIKKELEVILRSFLNFHLGRELKSQKAMHKIDNVVPAGVGG